MDAKLKAEELIDKFMPHSSGNSNNNEAKQCALIAVDEVFSVITVVPYGITYLSLVDYWQEVKEEIEKV